MKKLLSVMLAVLMLFVMYIPASAIELETVEAAAEFSAETISAEAELAGTAGVYTPGLNMYTGSASVNDYTYLNPLYASENTATDRWKSQ